MSSLEKPNCNLVIFLYLIVLLYFGQKERGFFAEFGLNVTLVKEASWASLRDRLAFGLLDAAHCLSAMLPAAAVGADQIGIALQTPLVLSENRAFISLSQKLCYELAIHTEDSAEISAQKLVSFIQDNNSVSLAHVFQHSIHHYCLREWLALADEKLAHSIQVKTLPPPYMVEALSNHLIDGFCVGEPWNTQSEIQGLSHIICSSQHIIPNVADKVLAVTKEWAQQNPNTLIHLTKAILKAQQELRELKDFDPVWQLLVNFEVVQFDCSAEVHVERYFAIQNIIRNFIQDSAIPKVDDFEWLFEQMKKWSNLSLESASYTSEALGCLLPETYALAAE